MNFEIITPARSKQDFLTAGENEYLKRLKRHAKIKITEVNHKVKAATERELIEAEGELLLQKAKKGAVLIALDENGTSVSSQGLADLFMAEFNQGSSTISFLIGGPYGISEKVKKTASHSISLSPLTFTAQFARLILTEQIYRAVSIINGMPYHKE